MSIGSVDLATIQQTLTEMRLSGVASVTGGATNAGNTSFATSLAQATNDIAATDSSSSIGITNDPMASAPVSSSFAAPTATTSASDPGIGLLSTLLATQLAPTPGTVVGDTSQVISTAPVPTSEPGASTVSGAQVVSEATNYEGTPYLWGGTTPQGFDCSGFTQYVYSQLGVSLPRTSEEQATVGTAVNSVADAQPGDLLFFAGSDGTASSPGHVGIYLGNGMMIDAPYTGTTVQEQSLSSAGPVVAVRRVLTSDSSTTPTTMGKVAVPGQYASTVQEAAAANGIPSSLLAALLSRESNFNPSAVSPAGAQGIAQFMPSTAAGMGVDPFDPTQAINGAAQLLSSYTKEFGSYADALAAYNAGATAVRDYGGIPPYAQTQAYVPAVLSLAGLSTPTTVVS